jgi:hypothetical protein
MVVIIVVAKRKPTNNNDDTMSAQSHDRSRVTASWVTAFRTSSSLHGQRTTTAMNKNLACHPNRKLFLHHSKIHILIRHLFHIEQEQEALIDARIAADAAAIAATTRVIAVLAVCALQEAAAATTTRRDVVADGDVQDVTAADRRRNTG